MSTAPQRWPSTAWSPGQPVMWSCGLREQARWPWECCRDEGTQTPPVRGFLRWARGEAWPLANCPMLTTPRPLRVGAALCFISAVITATLAFTCPPVSVLLLQKCRPSARVDTRCRHGLRLRALGPAFCPVRVGLCTGGVQPSGTGCHSHHQ